MLHPFRRLASEPRRHIADRHALALGLPNTEASTPRRQKFMSISDRDGNGWPVREVRWHAR